MEEWKIKKIIKKSLSFPDVKKTKNKNIKNELIIPKFNSLKNIKFPLKIKNYKNKSLENQNHIFTKTNSTKTIFDKINENIIKIKQSNIKIRQILKKNIENINKELFQKKLKNNKYKSNINNSLKTSYNINRNKNNIIYNKIDNNIFNKTTTYTSYPKSERDSNKNNSLNNKNNLSIYSTTGENIIDKSNDYKKEKTNPLEENKNNKNLEYTKIVPIKINILQHKRNINIDEIILRNHAYQLFTISPLLIY